jgi:hypothetical protein
VVVKAGGAVATGIPMKKVLKLVQQNYWLSEAAEAI